MCIAAFTLGCHSNGADNNNQGSTTGQEKEETSAQSDDSSPVQPECDELVEEEFENDQAEIRPNTRVADLLAGLSQSIPIRYRASKKNRFTFVPELDAMEGSVQISYTGGGIRYAYWKQSKSSSIRQDESSEIPACMDELSISVDLVLKTADGHLDESIPGTLVFQLVPGAAVDLSTLKGRFIRILGALESLRSKFEMTEPEINPKDSFGDTYFGFLMTFTGPRPDGYLVGTREIILGQPLRRTDDPPVLEAIFHIGPKP